METTFEISSGNDTEISTELAANLPDVKFETK